MNRDQTRASQSAEICGEVGTSFTTDHEPHYTDPCRLPADHDELHDWAQREAAGEPSPAELATAEDQQQFATIKTHFARHIVTLTARAERAEAERDRLVEDVARLHEDQEESEGTLSQRLWRLSQDNVHPERAEAYRRAAVMALDAEEATNRAGREDAGLQISDEMVETYRKAWFALPIPSTPAERVRAGLAAAVDHLHAELTFARDNAKSIYDTCKQVERERDTLREVARTNQRHVATLGEILDRIEQAVTRWSNKPGDLDYDCRTQILSILHSGGTASVPGSSRRAQECSQACTEGHQYDETCELGSARRAQDDPMPVFVIKAKDEFALAAIRAYRALCDEHGLCDQAREVGKAHREMREWRVRHPELTKLPDHKHVPADEDQASEQPIDLDDRPTPPQLARKTAEQLAQLFHETYELLAPRFGYRTREASAKPWSDVPEQNKALMIATCSRILVALNGGPDTPPSPPKPPARAFLGEPACGKPGCPCGSTQ